MSWTDLLAVADRTKQVYAEIVERLFRVTAATPGCIETVHVADLLKQIGRDRASKGKYPISANYQSKILTAVRAYCRFHAIPDPTKGLKP